jgi:hypothetical protein
MDSRDVLDLIAGGTMDDYLDDIARGVSERRKAKGSHVARGLRAGDTVAMSDSIRPRYLAGLPVTVVRVDRAAIVVTCPDEAAYGRFQNARRVRLTNTLIGEKIA